MKKGSAKKVLLLFALFVAGCAASYAWAPTYLANILIAYTAPLALTLFWLKKERGKVLVFSAVTVALFAFPLELVSRVADAWDVQSVFPRIWGLIPVENLLYAFVNFLWVLAFYECFVDRKPQSFLGRRWPYLVGIYAVFCAAVFGIFFLNPERAGVPYWGVGVGVFLVVSILLLRKPRLLRKTILPTAFFAAAFFLHEIVSMKLGHWWWPGEYLLPASLFGMPFPLDDAIIWYFLSTPALIAGYEFFADDYA
jgi:hypothetical protein